MNLSPQSLKEHKEGKAKIKVALLFLLTFFVLCKFALAQEEQPVSAADFLEKSMQAESVSEEKKSYIENKIKIYDVQAKYYESVLDGKVPGIDFKIKNLGERSISKVEVTVYFLDSAGTVIFEDTFYPIVETGYLNDTKPLKPNYIWQQERGKFFSSKSVPSEWREGAIQAVVTNVDFE